MSKKFFLIIFLFQACFLASLNAHESVYQEQKETLENGCLSNWMRYAFLFSLTVLGIWVVESNQGKNFSANSSGH